MRRYAFLFVVILSQLSGCAVWYSMQSDLEQRIDQWVEAKDYATALDTLEQIRPSHPQYEQLQIKKQRILQLSKNYEADILRRAAAETKQQHWRAAAQLYEQGMEKLPPSNTLTEAYQTFSRLRQQQLELTTYQMQLYKAEWLLKNLPLQQQLQELTPTGQRIDASVLPTEDEIGALYNDLVHCGQATMMHNADLELAEECFTTAAQLNPEGKRFPATIDISQQLVELTKRRAASLSSKGEELLANSRQALHKDDLHQAYKLFNKIPAEDQHNSAVIALRKELNIRISNNVKQGIEMGRKLYSQGDIERALAIWNNVRELDPQNEQLDNHIERAQRVLNKLKLLKKNEPVIAPPSTKKENN